MGIGKVLKRLLEEKDTNVNELSEKINVSPQTLYSIIKRDNMKVDLDVLYKICEFLNVELELFYEEYKSKIKNDNPIILSTDEQELLSNYKQLNEDGQEKAFDYVEDLVELGKYKKDDTVSNLA